MDDRAMSGNASTPHNWAGDCEGCGLRFTRYAPPSRPNPRFCSPTCRAIWLGRREKSAGHRAKLGRPREKHHFWKGGAVAPTGGRARALRWFPARPCEACAAPVAERHHRNADTADNTPENIRFLCRGCHMTEDGRILKLQQARHGKQTN